MRTPRSSRVHIHNMHVNNVVTECETLEATSGIRFAKHQHASQEEPVFWEEGEDVVGHWY